MIAGNTPEAIDALPIGLSDLRGVRKYSDTGHWLQQERPHGHTRILKHYREMLIKLRIF